MIDFLKTVFQNTISPVIESHSNFFLFLSMAILISFIAGFFLFREFLVWYLKIGSLRSSIESEIKKSMQAEFLLLRKQLEQKNASDSRGVLSTETTPSNNQSHFPLQH
jgi:hypothetical protein